MNHPCYNLLLASFDRPLTPSEAEKLRQALANSPELLAAQQQLEANQLALNQYAQQIKPHAWLATKVAEKIAAQKAAVLPATNSPPNLQQVLANLFPRMALATCLLLATLLGWAYMAKGEISFESIAGIDVINYDETEFDADELNEMGAFSLF